MDYVMLLRALRNRRTRVEFTTRRGTPITAVWYGREHTINGVVRTWNLMSKGVNMEKELRFTPRWAQVRQSIGRKHRYGRLTQERGRKLVCTPFESLAKAVDYVLRYF